MLSLHSLTKILLGLCFLTLLLVAPGTFVYPFIAPKVFFFRSVITVLAGLWLLLAVRQPRRFGPRTTPITIILGLVFVSAAISTVLGVDPYRSLWGTQERQLGLFTLLHYGVFYLVAASVVEDRRSWRALLALFLGVSACVMLVGLVQRVDPQFLHNRGSYRVVATLGHPAYVGGLGAFTVLLSLFLVVGDKSPWFRTYAALAGLSGLAGVLTSGTRSAAVGLGLGLMSLCVAYCATAPRRSQRRRVLGGVLVAMVLLGGGLFTFRDAVVVKSIPALYRLTEFSPDRGSARIRVLAWEIALEAAGERPLVGWGPSNYYYAFNRFYRPGLLEHGYDQTWVDDAHNVPLNTLVSQGVPGLVIYCGLFGVPLFLLWRSFRRDEVSSHVACFGTAVLLTHTGHSLFVFENPASLLYLMLFLAFIDRQLRGERAAPADRATLHPGLSLVTALAVVVAVWLANIEPARANMVGADAIAALHRSDVDDSLAALKSAVGRRAPHASDLRNLFAVEVLKGIPRFVEAGRARDARSLAQGVYSELAPSVERHPFDVRVVLRRAKLALALATRLGDGSRLQEAEEELSEARSLSPRRQELLFLLASVQLMLGKGEKAVALLREAADAAPQISESWCRLALVHHSLGRKDEARSCIEEGRQKGASFRGRFGAIAASILDDAAVPTAAPEGVEESPASPR